METNQPKNNVEQLIAKFNSGWEKMFPDSDVEDVFINPR